MSPSDQPNLDGGSMSFGEHLHELRGRVFKALVVPLPLAIGFFFIASWIRDLLVAPLFAALRANGQTVQIQALSPAETITTDMKLSVIAALSVSAPWLLYQLWKFVEPGLYAHERRYVHFLTPLSSLLTLCGIALFYWILLPFTLLFLVGFGASQPRKIPIPDPVAVTTAEPGESTTVDNATAQPSAVAPAETPGESTTEPPAEVSAAPTPLPTFPVLDEDPASPKPGEAWISAKDQVLRVAVPTRTVTANKILELANDASAAVGALEPVAPTISILEIPLTVLGGISQVYRLSEYINFALLLLAGSVIAFQMPVAILLLGWVGIVQPKLLREKRRWAVFIMAIIAAIVTPPDITSMLLLLVPLWLLYEFGIVLLVLVPAHRVAQGRVFSVRRGAAQPAQTDSWRDESRANRADGVSGENGTDDDAQAGSGSS
jgi:sec-independent protein translocase protein TatC